MALRTGISTLRRGSANPTTDGLSSAINSLNDNLLIARVKDVCLNTNSGMFRTTGEYFGIGAIKWEDIKISNSNKTKKTSYSVARPLQPFIKEFPLVDEYVIVFRGPEPDNPGATSLPTYYYLPLKLWNDNEQNAYPDPLSIQNNQPPQNSKSYVEIENGVNVEFVQEPTEDSFNGTSEANFSEKGNVKAVLPFIGDRIFEGRFGNSIRLGSTARTQGIEFSSEFPIIKNNWSNSGEEGMPITILKNGQPMSTSSEGYIPITEDINLDPASLYLTSTQQIPLEVSTLNKKAGEGTTVPFSGMVKNTPISPFSYNRPQIILNSGRLLFNSSTDNIILSSAKSVVMDSMGDSAIRSKDGNVNVLTPKGNISLGSTNADEAVILGTTFIQNFDSFLGGLSTLFKALSKEAGLSVSAGFAYTLYQTQISNFRKDLQNMLSEKVKVK